MDDQIFAFLKYFEKLSRRSQSFAQRNIYKSLKLVGTWCIFSNCYFFKTIDSHYMTKTNYR